MPRAELFGLGAILLLFLLTVPTFIVSGSGGGGGSVDANIGLIDLNDGQSSYGGYGGKFLKVNPTETGWVFADANSSSADTNASCTVTVASSLADFNNIPDAVDFLKTTGGRVCISAETFTLTRPIDINGSNIQIVGSGVTTTIKNNPVSIPIAMRVGDNTQHSGILISNLSFFVSTATGSGTALDASNLTISKIENIWINGYNKGIDFNKNNTFYNTVDNVRISVSTPGAFGIRLGLGANNNSIYRTRIITDDNGTGIIVDSHGNSLQSVNVESGSAIGIDVRGNGNDTTIVGPYLESNIINLKLASGIIGFGLFGGSFQSGTIANILDLGADKPVMTGMRLNASTGPSVFGDINAVGDINTSKNINVLGDVNSSDAMKAHHYDTYNVGQDYVLQVYADMWAFCVFGTNPCSGLKFVNTGRKGYDFTINGVSIVHFGASNAQGVIFLPPRIADPTSGSGDKNSGAMYVKSTDLNRLVINTGTFASPTFTEVGANILGNWETQGDAHVIGTLTVDTNIHGQLLSGVSAVGTTCNAICGGYSTAGPWTCVEATSQAGIASTCGDVTILKNCICKN